LDWPLAAARSRQPAHAPPPSARPPAPQECLAPEEQGDFRITWRPPTAKLPKAVAVTATAATLPADVKAAPGAAPADAKAAAAAAGSKQVAPAGGAHGSIEERKARVAGAVVASKQGGWALFHYNVLAYLYKVRRAGSPGTGQSRRGCASPAAAGRLGQSSGGGSRRARQRPRARRAPRARARLQPSVGMQLELTPPPRPPPDPCPP
jgi:hypothetical protein